MPEAITTHAAPVLRRCGGRQCPPGTCDHDGTLRRHAHAAGPATAPPVVHRVLGTPGQPLDRGARSYLEPRFGHDFSQVRVHTDAAAATSATAVGAHAYTVGNHITFAAGTYRPGTAGGRRLLAHELAHVVQQSGTTASPAPALAVGASDAPQEVEADRAANAVLAGRHAPPMGGAGAGVARQDAGATPDAGPATTPSTTPDAGPATTPSTTPDAGPDAGTPAGGAGPGIPPAAVPRILRVEVENQQEAITFPVPSNLGAAGRQHWVTIAGARPDITVRAVLDSALPAGDPAVSGLTWESDPAGALAPGGDVLHATTSVPTARKAVVRARLGASTAELTLWAVFVQVASTGLAPTHVRAATRVNVGADAHFRGQIFPASLITDVDRPALDGPRTDPPPGGTNVCGTPLGGGATLRWDMSQQYRLRNIDPAGLIPAVDAAIPPACLDAEVGYPAQDEIGNDDTHTDDENNDPYANAGVITSDDPPNNPYPDSVGADGDTIEQHLQFRVFARLNFHHTWWKVSHFAPWRVHMRVVRVAGHWQDNGTDVANNNAGF